MARFSSHFFHGWNIGIREFSTRIGCRINNMKNQYKLRGLGFPRHSRTHKLIEYIPRVRGLGLTSESLGIYKSLGYTSTILRVYQSISNFSPKVFFGSRKRDGIFFEKKSWKYFKN